MVVVSGFGKYYKVVGGVESSDEEEEKLCNSCNICSPRSRQSSYSLICNDCLVGWLDHIIRLSL
jgi:hypothetical protein